MTIRNFFKDQIVCFTGGFTCRTRDALTKIVEVQGGRIESRSLTRRTTLLVVSQKIGLSKPNTKKLRRAKELGVPLLAEEEFCLALGVPFQQIIPLSPDKKKL